MRCLLCDATMGPSERVFEGIWSCDGARCGPYIFDVPFDHVARAARAAMVSVALYQVIAAELDDVPRDATKPVASS